MSNVAVVRLFARLRWKMLRGALNSDGAQKWAVAVGLIGSVAARRHRRSGAVRDAAGPPTTRDAVRARHGRHHVRRDDDRCDRRAGAAGRPAGAGNRAAHRAPTRPRRARRLRVRATRTLGRPGRGRHLRRSGARAWLDRGRSTLAVVAFLATLLLVSRTTVNALGLLAVRFPRAGQLVVGIASLAFYAAFQIVPRHDPRHRAPTNGRSWPTGCDGRRWASSAGRSGAPATSR